MIVLERCFTVTRSHLRADAYGDNRITRSLSDLRVIYGEYCRVNYWINGILETYGHMDSHVSVGDKIKIQVEKN